MAIVRIGSDFRMLRIHDGCTQLKGKGKTDLIFAFYHAMGLLTCSCVVTPRRTKEQWYMVSPPTIKRSKKQTMARTKLTGAELKTSPKLADWSMDFIFQRSCTIENTMTKRHRRVAVLMKTKKGR